MKALDINSTPSLNSDYYELHVDEVIEGNISTETIILNQLSAQTKLKTNQSYILFLSSNPDSKYDLTYYPFSFEDCVFEIKKNGKLYSLSSNPYTMKKNDTDYKDLIKEIKSKSKDK